MGEVGGTDLMRPRAGDSVIMERTEHIWISPGRPVRAVGLASGKLGDVAQCLRRGFGTRDGRAKQLAAETHHLKSALSKKYLQPRIELFIS
jgi:hypothetical protein